MVRTINLTAEVPANHRLTITLPDEIPTGPAEMVLVIASQNTAIQRTLGDLAASEFFGAWQGRDDIGDPIDFARQLREKAWSRKP